MRNKYSKPCHYCREEVPPGAGRCWKYGRRWYVSHDECAKEAKAKRQARAAEPESDAQARAEYVAEQRERAREDAEFARGVALAGHLQDTARFFGEDAAAAEELAWSLKDPDPAY